MRGSAESSPPVSAAWGFAAMSVLPYSSTGEVWGALMAGSDGSVQFPADAEARLADVTNLIATAISNAESQSALASSRMRIVTAADETRRRIERNLHDGTQQQLVSLALELRAAQSLGAA